MRNVALVPTSSSTNRRASVTRTAYVPNARRRTGPSSASRTITGFDVPHFWPMNWRVLRNTTSALNGLSKPYFQPCRLDRTGRFDVESTCRPGSNASAMRPWSTRMATCDCRTISCAPFLISFPGRENRQAIVSSVSSTHSMTSINSPARKSRSVMDGSRSGEESIQIEVQREALVEPDRGALRRFALRFGRSHAIEAAVGDELKHAAQLVALEPHPVILADVDDDARHLSEVHAVHDLVADGAVDVANF